MKILVSEAWELPCPHWVELYGPSGVGVHCPHPYMTGGVQNNICCWCGVLEIEHGPHLSVITAPIIKPKFDGALPGMEQK